MKDVFKKIVLPIVAIILLLWIGEHIYMVDGQIDWFRLYLVIGIPFGFPYMIWIIPLRGSVAEQVGILVMDALCAALIGCFVAAGMVIRAVFLIPITVVRLIRKQY